MIAADVRLRRLLLAAAAACYAGVFAAFAVAERPALGLGHFYYVAIVLAAMASGPLGGGIAGLLATALYALGVYINPHLPVGQIRSEATAIRLVTYVLVGALIGYYASRSRSLLGRAEELTVELRALARRDFVTGLPNQRAFQRAITSRIDDGLTFAVVLCDLPPAAPGVDPESHALAFAERLSRAVDAEVDVARIGEAQFAAVAPVADERGAVAVTARIERALTVAGRRGTAGWATYPRDAADGLGLFTAASERLYARKIARGEWAGAPA